MGLFNVFKKKDKKEVKEDKVEKVAETKKEEAPAPAKEEVKAAPAPVKEEAKPAAKKAPAKKEEAPKVEAKATVAPAKEEAKPAAKKAPAKKEEAPKAEAKATAAPAKEEAKPAAKKAPAKKEEAPKEEVKTAPAKKTAAPKKEEAIVEEIPKDDEVSDEDEAVAVEENGKPVRNGKFDVKKAKDGRYYFCLYASNKQVIAYSQLYASVTSAMNGIKSVIAHAPKAAIEDTTLKKPNPQSFPKWEIYIDKAGEHRFRLYASNGSCICHSHGYASKATCKGGMESIQRFASESADIDKTYLKK